MPPDATSVGRASERERLRGFLHRAASRPAALLLSGPAGIGKTTLWRSAIGDARERGFRVLETRAVEAEVQLAFGGLADLIGAYLDVAAVDLPAAQREALDLALQRIAAQGRVPPPLAVSLGTLGVIRALASGSRPTLVAVDDLPWLDPASTRVLEYVMRRVEGLPVGLLAAMRTEDGEASAPEVVRAVPGEVDRLHVGPIEVDAMDELLRGALGASFRRPDLQRIHAESHGNPFVALEIARAVQRGAAAFDHGLLELRTDAAALVGGRLDGLPGGTRAPLAAVAALSQPTLDLLVAAFPQHGEAIEAAIAAGVLERDGQRLRFSHPLLAAGAYARLDPDERKSVHRRLAELAPDPEQRARHRALASDEPTESVAVELEAAAAHARSRGATDVAAELAREAAAHTPVSDARSFRRRVLEAAGYLVQAGDPDTARGLVEGLLNGVPAGPDRAEVLLALADIRSSDDWSAKLDLLNQALDEAEAPGLRSRILEQRSQCRFHLLVDGAGSLADARASLEAARRQDDPSVLCSALHVTAFAESNVEGASGDALLEESLTLQPAVEHLRVFLWPLFAMALRDLERDRLDAAGERLAFLRGRATTLGDWDSLPIITMNLAWLAARRGEWAAARAYAIEAERDSRQNGQPNSVAYALAARGVVDAMSSNEAAALAAAAEGLEITERLGVRAVSGEHHATMAVVAMGRGDHVRAEAAFRAAMQPALEAGYLESYTAHLIPAWAETLVHLGRLPEAVELLDPYDDRATERGIPSAMAACARARGVIAAGAGAEAAALAALDEAIARHADVDEPFERARTLLALGESLRRFRQRGRAREPLAEALAIFTRLPAPRWRDRAAAELARTGHREPGAELSPTERQVAELVAAGRTNREVAEQLFMSPHTVEAHLTRIYRSLGVRGRTEMARALAARAARAAEDEGSG